MGGSVVVFLSVVVVVGMVSVVFVRLGFWVCRVAVVGVVVGVGVVRCCVVVVSVGWIVFEFGFFVWDVLSKRVVSVSFLSLSVISGRVVCRYGERASKSFWM